MTTIKISVLALTNLDPKILGTLVLDEIDNRCHGPNLEECLGEWFAGLSNTQIGSFFEMFAGEAKPAKPVSPRAKAPAKKKATPFKSYSPPKAKSRRASRARPSSAPVVKQAPLPFAGDEEEEPKTAKPRRPPLATGDQLAADGEQREKVLDFLKRNPNVSASTLQTMCALSAGQTKGLLKRLREQGSVRVEGKNRGARYSLAQTNGASAHV